MAIAPTKALVPASPNVAMTPRRNTQTQLQATQATMTQVMNNLVATQASTMYISPNSTGTWTTSTNSTAPVTNSINTIVLNSYADLIVDGGGGDHHYLKSLLRSEGLELADGSRLKMIDELPFIEHRHTDGSDTMRHIPVSHYGEIDFSGSDHSFRAGTIIKLPDGSCLEIDKNKDLIHETYINARPRPIDVSGGNLTLYESLAFCHFREIHIPDSGGKGNVDTTFELPNGVKLKLFADDHVEIDDSNGRQLYQSTPIRGFNRFMNASDLMEEFIGYCAEQNLTRKDFAELPVSLFIYWLIVQAAEADGDTTEETIPLLTSAVAKQRYHAPHCKCCGKFIRPKLVDKGIHFCSSDHMQKYMDKLEE